VNDFDAFDDAVEEALRRRAGEVPSSPLGYTDVQRRMVQRRRRTATFVTAAVTLPAVVGLGYLAGRRDTAGAPAGAFPGTSFDGGTITTQPLTVPTTTIVGEYMPAGSIFRCQGSPVAQDDVWQYFGYCEYVPPAEPIDPSTVFPTTTVLEQVFPTTTWPPVTTTVVAQLDPAALADQVLVVDASGGVASMTAVASLLGTVPRYAVVAGRTVDETMVMPLGTEVGAAYELLQRFGVGGFDTWTPDLIATEVPAGVTVALVIGTSGPLAWTP
jgi:hypothetical protein